MKCCCFTGRKRSPRSHRPGKDNHIDCFEKLTPKVKGAIQVLERVNSAEPSVRAPDYVTKFTNNVEPSKKVMLMNHKESLASFLTELGKLKFNFTAEERDLIAEPEKLEKWKYEDEIKEWKEQAYFQLEAKINKALELVNKKTDEAIGGKKLIVKLIEKLDENKAKEFNDDQSNPSEFLSKLRDCGFNYIPEGNNNSATDEYDAQIGEWRPPDHFRLKAKIEGALSQLKIACKSQKRRDEETVAKFLLERLNDHSITKLLEDESNLATFLLRLRVNRFLFSSLENRWIDQPSYKRELSRYKYDNLFEIWKDPAATQSESGI